MGGGFIGEGGLTWNDGSTEISAEGCIGELGELLDKSKEWTFVGPKIIEETVGPKLEAQVRRWKTQSLGNQ